MDIAIVGLGVALTMDASGTVSAARVGERGRADRLYVADADAALIGSKLDDEALERAAETCRQACNPINDKRGTVEYRTKIAGVLMKRAAKIAAERAGVETMAKNHVTTTINNEPVEFLCDTHETMLDVLRNDSA